MSYKLQAAIGVAVAGFVNASMAADDVYRLDDVVVTASRTAQTVDQALAAVTVITREEIERSQATSVQELIRRAPGVQVSGNGGLGAQTSVFIRGAASQQTLLLVDGQRVNSATAGVAELQYLNPDQIEKIEIVRGPGSSLYGADAVGGIIHVFTRQGRDKPHVSVKAGVGNMGTHGLGINAGGQSGSTRFYIGANLLETEGFDVTNNNYRDFLGNNLNTGANRDKDGYRNKSVSASLSHRFDNDSEAGIRVSHAEGKSEYDAADNNLKPYNAYTLFNNTSLNGYYSLPVNDQWLSRIDLGYVDNESKQRGDRVEEGSSYTQSFFATKRLSAQWQNDLAWSDVHLLTLGLDYYQDKVDNSQSFINPRTGKVEDSRYNTAVFIQNQSSFNHGDLQVALRRDKNQSYGYNTTGNLAYGHDLPKNMRFIASYGTAFRAPTFNDLYFPDEWMPGNPDLKPETSENIEFSLKGDHAIGVWQVSVFQNDIDDMIQWAEGANGKWTPSNVDEARIRGIEFSLDTHFMNWDIHTAVTLLDPEDKKLKKTLQRRARQTLQMDADRRYGKWSFGGSVYAQGHSYDKPGHDDRLAGFTTIDLRVARQINNEVKAELKVTNLLDKEYHVAREYNTQPRAGIFSVTWTPEI